MKFHSGDICAPVLSSDMNGELAKVPNQKRGERGREERGSTGGEAKRGEGK